MVTFHNPLSTVDWSDPDVIRVRDDFYMISSSFNYFPCIPILHSKDLVHWEIINYVTSHLQGDFSSVRPGEGAWAPSIRFHNGTFYVLVPQPDEGIFVYVSKDIHKEFTYHSCLMKGKGYEDPCPVWIKDKAYVVFAFVKSRIGFHSKLGLMEVSEDLSKCLSVHYQIIYDGEREGEKQNPDIEGPKVHYSDGKVFISAPAGGVEDGYQELLVSSSVYGPYSCSTILEDKEHTVNGPHQGALVSLDDAYKDFAFIHFSSRGNLGRITYLEPGKYVNGTFVIGKNGSPLLSGSLPLKEHKEYHLDFSDSLKGKLSLLWQLPCDLRRETFLKESKEGLYLRPTVVEKSIRLHPFLLQEKISSYHQQYSVHLDAGGLKEEEEAGLGIFGSDSVLLSVHKEKGHYYLEFLEEKEEKLTRTRIREVNSSFNLQLRYDFPSSVTYEEKGIRLKGEVKKEHWSGLHVGLFAFSQKKESGFSVLFEDFRVLTLK